MAFTELQDEDTRLSQYREALEFYLYNTDLQVVVCENTLFDFSAPYKRFIDEERLEFLTFNGNNYDRSLGKGYGEARIIEHALVNSRLITDNRYVIKVTGRVIIDNITDIAYNPVLRKGNLLRCNLLAPAYFDTLLLIFKRSPMLKLLRENMESINDSASPPRYFETVVSKAAWKAKDMRLVPFFFSPRPKGIAGTTGKPYTHYRSIVNTYLNLRYIKGFYPKSAIKVLAYWAYCLSTCALVGALSAFGIFTTRKNCHNGKFT